MPISYRQVAMGETPGIPWERVERRLRNAETYWLATTRPDGRPHSMPVYGLWRERAFWFGTDRGSVKGRNLAANAGAVVHLESAGDVVIVEGRAEQVGDPAVTDEVTPLLAAKYGVGGRGAGPGPGRQRRHALPPTPARGPRLARGRVPADPVPLGSRLGATFLAKQPTPSPRSPGAKRRNTNQWPRRHARSAARWSPSPAARGASARRRRLR